MCVNCYFYKENKRTPNNHSLCFPVLLEACTVFTFVLGVTDHDLLRVSQLSWSFYITSSTMCFTFLFLFVLLHNTLYCKYLSCLSVVLWFYVSYSPFSVFYCNNITKNNEKSRTIQSCNANIVPTTWLTMMLWKIYKKPTHNNCRQ